MKKEELINLTDALFSNSYNDMIFKSIMEPSWFETINKYIYTDHYLFYLNIPYIDWHYCDDDECDHKHFGGVKWYNKGFIKTKTTRKKNPNYKPPKPVTFKRYSDLSSN